MHMNLCDIYKSSKILLPVLRFHPQLMSLSLSILTTLLWRYNLWCHQESPRNQI